MVSILNNFIVFILLYNIINYNYQDIKNMDQEILECFFLFLQVTHNHRFVVTHNGHNTWTLHIKHVQQNDSGTYMCQVNTNPAKNQVSAFPFQFTIWIGLDWILYFIFLPRPVINKASGKFLWKCF